MTDVTTLDTKFHHLLQDQIRTEFTAAQQYIAIAVYFDGADLPQLAKHFYAQAVEERNHAMMLVQYLLDRDVDVEIPGTDPVRNTFVSPTEALRLALEQERAVTEQISRLAARRPRRGRLPRRAVHAVVPQGAGRGGRADHHAGPGRATGPAPTCSTSRTSWPARSARQAPMPTAPKAAGGSL